MAGRLKVLEVLSTDEVEQLEAYCRERSRTVDDVHQWLLERSFNVSRSAAYGWRTQFDAARLHERFSNSGDLARAIKGAIGEGKLTDVAEAAAMNLTQVVFEASADLQADGKADPLDVARWASSLRTLVGTKADADELRAKQQSAVAEADRVAKAGGSGDAVVAKVREILGMGAA